MAVTQSAAPASARVTGTTPELTFRVQGGMHDGRILRIASAKCSIGSATGCTLRLRGHDIDPLHCLIVTGRNGTVIRRNSPRTYLNGGAFTDAVLSAGDVLRIGSVELVVESCQASFASLKSARGKESAEQSLPNRDQQRLTADLAAISEELRQAKERLARAEQSQAEAASEQARTEKQLREEHAQSQENILSQQRLTAELAATSEELRQAKERLARAEQSQAEAASEQARTEKQLREEHAQSLENVLSQQRAERAENLACQENWTAERKAQQEQRAEEQARYGEQRQQLEARVTELEGEVRRAQNERDQLQREHACQGQQTEQQSAEWTARLRERDQELERRDQELVELRQRAEQFSAVQSQVAELQQKLAEDARAQQAARESWLNEWSELEERLKAAEAARGEVEIRLNARTAEYQDLQALSALEKEEIERTCGDLRALCTNLESQRDALEAQIVELQAAQQNATAAPPDTIDEAGRQHDEQIERWQSEVLTWQVRAEETATELSQARQACSKLEEEIRELQAANRAVGASEEERRNLDILRGELEMQRNELIAAREKQEQEMEQAQLQEAGEGSPQQESLAQSTSDFAEQQRAWELSRIQQEAALEERSQLIASQIAQFEAEKEAFNRQQASIIQQMTSLEDRVQELTTSGDCHSTNSPFVIPRLDDPALRGEPDGAGRNRPEDAAEAEELPIKVPYSPPGFLDNAVEAEMVQEEEEQGTAELPSPPMTARLLTNEDDDSIEKYMSRLLNRVRGSQTLAAGGQESNEGQAELTANGDGESPATAESANDKGAAEVQEYIRSLPPEHPERLSLMRELANSAAKSAIHTHARQHRKRQTKTKSLVALLSLSGAAILYAAGCFTGARSAMIGSAGFFGLFCVMSIRAMIAGFLHMRLGPPQKIGDRPEPSEPAVPEQSAQS